MKFPRFLSALLLAGALCSPAFGQAFMQGAALFTDTSTPLGGAATYTGASHDLTGSPFYAHAGCFFRADQAGTAFLDISADGTNFFQSATSALVAGTPIDLDVRVRVRAFRCRFVNGATPQGAFNVFASATTS